uniref:(northern house mosquito) hypothetical protein n=1 Tax=Culex pipiens TaxID=7175 RepID=A0A8D8DME7_CULPI
MVVVVKVGRTAELVLNAHRRSQRRRRSVAIAKIGQTAAIVRCGRTAGTSGAGAGIIWCVTFVRNWFERDRTDHLLALAQYSTAGLNLGRFVVSGQRSRHRRRRRSIVPVHRGREAAGSDLGARSRSRRYLTAVLAVVLLEDLADVLKVCLPDAALGGGARRRRRLMMMITGAIL